MDNINNANTLAEKKVNTVLAEILKTFPDKFESPLDKSRLKVAIATAFTDLVSEDKSLRESVFSSNYLTNVRPDGKYNGDIEAMIYKDGNGGYKAALNVYDISGNGPMAISTPKLKDRSRPLDELTIEYVKSKAPNVPEADIAKWLEKIRDVIQSKEEASQNNKNQTPLRERIKAIIRKKLNEIEK
jgi:hypothetical protein